MKVLVVDDNKSISGMISKLLKLEGHECVVANDGRNGLTLINENNFDAITLDLAMPGFSGVQVIEELAKTGKIKDQKIIVLTASSTSEDDLDHLKEKGVKAILKKPVDIDLLLETLQQ